jgi:hypothetical protein
MKEKVFLVIRKGTEFVVQHSCAMSPIFFDFERCLDSNPKKSQVAKLNKAEHMKNLAFKQIQIFLIKITKYG